MAHSYGSIFALQQEGNWLSYNIATTNYNGMFTCHTCSCTFDQFDYSCRSTWKKTVGTDDQVAYIDRVKAVYILFHGDCINNSLLLDMLRQWELNQNSVDIIASV
ncbi:hypothetical protein D3C76_1463380 [compost metagenome]